jgi:hypothetical protein
MSLASSEINSSSVVSEASSRPTPSRSLRADLTARTKVVTTSDVFPILAVKDTQAPVIERGSMMRRQVGDFVGRVRQDCG